MIAAAIRAYHSRPATEDGGGLGFFELFNKLVHALAVLAGNLWDAYWHLPGVPQIVIALGGFGWILSYRIWPWRPCRACKGKSSYAFPLNKIRSRDCGVCGSAGRAVCRGTRIFFPAHARRLG